MEKVFAKAEEMAAHVKDYVNNRIASVKLSAEEKKKMGQISWQTDYPGWPLSIQRNLLKKPNKKL